MPEEKWPRLPLAFSLDVPFLLVSGYRLYGVAESSRAYLEYSHTNGVFRTDRYKIPCKRETLNALDSLFRSERWKSIKWDRPAEMWLKHRLHLQVRRHTCGQA